MLRPKNIVPRFDFSHCSLSNCLVSFLTDSRKMTEMNGKWVKWAKITYTQRQNVCMYVKMHKDMLARYSSFLQSFLSRISPWNTATAVKAQMTPTTSLIAQQTRRPQPPGPSGRTLSCHRIAGTWDRPGRCTPGRKRATTTTTTNGRSSLPQSDVQTHIFFPFLSRKSDLCFLHFSWISVVNPTYHVLPEWLPHFLPSHSDRTFALEWFLF